MDTRLLEEVGLTTGEAKTYLALVELGESTTGPLISRTRMQKSTVYICLEKLLDKGLVTYIIKNNRKHFQPLPPDRIVEYLKQKGEELKAQEKRVASLIPQISVERERGPQQARFFTGWNGMKSAFDDILRTMHKGEEYYVFGVSAAPSIFERFRRFMTKFHKKRAHKGVKLKILVNEDLRHTIGADRAKNKHTEVRFISKEFSTPSVVNVYKNKTLIAIWSAEPAAVLIENEETAESFRNYFKLIRSTAK